MSERRAWREKRAWFLFAAALLVPAGAGAQEESRVGEIERIAELVGGGELVKIERESDRVQVRRGAQWVLAGPDSRLQMEDMLRVQRYVDVRFKVDRPAERGRLTFLPEVLLPDGARAFSIDSVGPHADYVVHQDSTAQRDLTVVVETGSLLVDWSVGRLAVVAAGVRSLITGTRVAYSLDASGDAGEIFLEEGSLTFPDFPGINVAPGQVVFIQRGLPPTVTAPPAEAAELYETAMRYNGEEIWSRLTPFWRRPVFLVPAAIAVTGGVVALLLTRDDGGTPGGTVIIRIPL
jgi:hypothetical protein